MSMPETIIEAQIERLLEVVQDYRSKHCREIIDQSRLDARDIVRSAYKTARQRLHLDVLDSRERMKQELAAARAKLDRAWELLTRQLERRWRTAAHRRLWVNMVFDVARQRLPSGQWQLESPQDWIQEERDDLVQQILLHTGITPLLKSFTDIKAGIRISANGATVNATIKGLTADRTRIEAELLAQVHL